MMSQVAILLFMSKATTSLMSPTERLSCWRINAAFAGDHTASIASGEEVRLSRYCGDGSIFPALSSRTQANNAAKRGELLLNGFKAHGASRVRCGDVLTLQSPPPPTLSPPELRRVEKFYEELTAEKPERGGRLKVLYEDDEMAIVFKPPGVHSRHSQEVGRADLVRCAPAASHGAA